MISNVSGFSIIKVTFINILVLFFVSTAAAQSWMPGYNFRKKITIHKSKVSGTLDFINFKVLLKITSSDLKYIPGLCSINKLLSTKGTDISFASTDASSVPLSFQLDHYDASTGQLICWVNIARLSAEGSSAPATEFYLYYGSNIMHHPYANQALITWSSDYVNVWHMNAEELKQNIIGSSDISQNNFSPAKIGNGVMLNGTSSFLTAPIDTSTNFTISAWIKLNKTGVSQVILSNDSIGKGGYILKINAAGNLVLDTYYLSYFHTTTGIYPMGINTWYHIVAILKNKNKVLYVNNRLVGSGSASSFRIGQGGSLSIGKSKKNDQYFNGVIDELRIGRLERNADWIKTEFNNQLEPDAFYNITSEEVNPIQSVIGAVFEGSKSDMWSEASNWNNNSIPENDMDITVKAGKTLLSSGNAPISINKLVLESGSKLLVQSDMKINCQTFIAQHASLSLANNVRVQFNNDVTNNGFLSSNGSTGILVFSGNKDIQFSGTGLATVHQMEINQALRTQSVKINSPIHIIGSLNLKCGILNGNSKLRLLSTSMSETASILPIKDLTKASIAGEVHVEKFVEGSLPFPATGRGWRLMSSPVYQGNGIVKEFNVQPLHKSIFITGQGGVANGFDASPNNGGTIYTHDQSLKGTLPQKYISLKDINSKIPFGKGIFVFSRGERNVLDAYSEQIITSPFSNPGSYIITYTGFVHSGDLTLSLSNSAYGEEGDGFNLLGNPYASAITWGNIEKVNVGAYVWLFDPLNNTYQVSDDPTLIIPSGSGFFVRVNHNEKTGSVKFTEAAKYTPLFLSVKNSFPESISNTRYIKKSFKEANNLLVTISRDVFFQEYSVTFKEGGKEDPDDQDALKIGDGYVNIAGLTSKNIKLAIEQRPPLKTRTEIKLAVSGWSAGPYKIDLKGADTFTDETAIFLLDKYLNIKQRVSKTGTVYPFTMDAGSVASQGENRFCLIFEPTTKINIINDGKWQIDGPSLYPNPFNDVIHLQTNSFNSPYCEILIRDLFGRVVWSKVIGPLFEGTMIDLSCSDLKKGVYLMELTDENKKRICKSYKIIKQ